MIGCMSDATREVRERRFAEAVAAYERGELTLTQARMVAGLASREARLAYRFPRLLGHLSRLSAADRLRPVYAPREGWALQGSDARRPMGLGLTPKPPRLGSDPRTFHARKTHGSCDMALKVRDAARSVLLLREKTCLTKVR